jgi:hypothetical protein
MAFLRQCCAGAGWTAVYRARATLVGAEEKKREILGA